MQLLLLRKKRKQQLLRKMARRKARRLKKRQKSQSQLLLLRLNQLRSKKRKKTMQRRKARRSKTKRKIRRRRQANENVRIISSTKSWQNNRQSPFLNPQKATPTKNSSKWSKAKVPLSLPSQKTRVNQTKEPAINEHPLLRLPLADPIIRSHPCQIGREEDRNQEGDIVEKGQKEGSKMSLILLINNPTLWAFL